MVFSGVTQSFWPGGGGRGGGLFVTCPRSRGPRPPMRRRREIAAGYSFVGKLGTGTTIAGLPVEAPLVQKRNGSRGGRQRRRGPPASSCPGLRRRPRRKGDPRD